MKMATELSQNSIEGLSPSHPLPASVLSNINLPTEPKAAWFRMQQWPLLALLGALPFKDQTEWEFRLNSSIKLTQVHFRVLFHLLGKIEFGNWITNAQTKLSEELKLSPQSYSRALQGLQEANLIVRPYVSTESGIRPIIMINPDLATKGRDKDIEKAFELYKEMKTNNKFRKIKGHGGQRKGSKPRGSLNK